MPAWNPYNKGEIDQFETVQLGVAGSSPTDIENI